MVAGAFAVFALVMTIIFFPETHLDAPGCKGWWWCSWNKRYNDDYQQQENSSMDNKSIKFKRLKSDEFPPAEEISLGNGTTVVQSVELDSHKELDTGSDSSIESSSSSDSSTSSNTSYEGSDTWSYMLHNRNIMVTTGLYGIIAFMSNVSNEIFPLWILTSKEAHGFEFTTHEIGLMLTVLGPFQLIYQLTLPWWVKRFGYIVSLQIALSVFCMGSIALPFVAYINTASKPVVYVVLVSAYLILVNLKKNERKKKNERIFLCCCCWLCCVPCLPPQRSISPTLFLLLLLLKQVCGRVTSFTCLFVLISNACTKENRGTVNGIGQSWAAVGRTVGPILGGISIAYSLTNDGAYPLNWMLDWHILSIVAIIAILIVRTLPESLNRMVKRKRETSNTWK